MEESIPCLRRDLEFFPVQHEGQQVILIRDTMGLVPEGKAVGLPLYQIMALLDGNRGMRDIQMELMRQKGGVLVSMDEVMGLVRHLDDSFLLDTPRFREARDRIIDDFSSKGVRPCSHCGNAYPGQPGELIKNLDDIIDSTPPSDEPAGNIRALIAPHIDLSVGKKVYSSAYRMLKFTAPSSVIILGVGHQMGGDLFSITDKDFETPLGIIKNNKNLINRLRKAGGDLISDNDFAHRSEHSIEFQTLFLQHLLPMESFTIVPVLCGSIPLSLPEYSRDLYKKKAALFLETLSQILMESADDNLLVAGVDLSHIGPKFGHEMPAQLLKSESETHDRNLLDSLCRMDSDHFWEEIVRVNDSYNVCGFSALASMLEVLTSCKGQVLDYQVWHEEPTRSAVSFAAAVFTSL